MSLISAMEPAIMLHPDPGPSYEHWRRIAEQTPNGALLGRSQEEWRYITRCELGIDHGRPVIATGHQTLLWHPGILAKYIAMETAAGACSFAKANMVVDQHVGEFAALDVPIWREDGSLGVSHIDLAAEDGSLGQDIPMGLQDPIPSSAPVLPYALASVGEGVHQIVRAINAHQDAPNAALQMGYALADLMQPWVGPVGNVTSADLCHTRLAGALMKRMAEEPDECAAAYNHAVAAVPEAGIPPLVVRHDRVEVPLWRITDKRRVRAFAADLTDVEISLLPRALFMTALVRLGMCDLFIHGTGGGAYDRAMELWVQDWLGVEVAPVAVVTADLRLPFPGSGEPLLEAEAARHTARHHWHDPEANHASDSYPSVAKRKMLDQIAALPRNSTERRAMFFAMHEQLESMRASHSSQIDEAQRRAEAAAARTAAAHIAKRRDWAFPLYPKQSIDGLAAAIRGAALCKHSAHVCTAGGS